MPVSVFLVSLLSCLIVIRNTAWLLELWAFMSEEGGREGQREGEREGEREGGREGGREERNLNRT